MPRVSVIMASYNHEKFVTEAIQSILDQSYQDFEILITDDASTDRTVEKIRKLADPRIRLYSSTANQGQYVATNKCLEKAKGEYIAVLNSDDVFLPGKLEKQVSFLDKHPEIGAVFTLAKIINGSGRDFADRCNSYCSIFNQPNRSRFEWLNHFYYKGNCLCHPSVLLRRECHESVGNYNEQYAQISDFDFWVRLCMEYEIHIIQEQLVGFRILPGKSNMSSKRSESLKRDCWEFRHILDNYLNIKSVDVFLKIFPEAEKYAEKIEDDLIAFVLALVTLENRSHRLLHRHFVLDTILRLLSNKETAQKISSRFGFNCIDFINLTGKYDVFNIAKVRKLNAMQKMLTGKTGRVILKFCYKLRRKMGYLISWLSS